MTKKIGKARRPHLIPLPFVERYIVPYAELASLTPLESVRQCRSSPTISSLLFLYSSSATTFCLSHFFFFCCSGQFNRPNNGPLKTDNCNKTNTRWVPKWLWAMGKTDRLWETLRPERDASEKGHVSNWMRRWSGPSRWITYASRNKTCAFLARFRCIFLFYFFLSSTRTCSINFCMNDANPNYH